MSVGGGDNITYSEELDVNGNLKKIVTAGTIQLLFEKLIYNAGTSFPRNFSPFQIKTYKEFQAGQESG